MMYSITYVKYRHIFGILWTYLEAENVKKRICMRVFVFVELRCIDTIWFIVIKKNTSCLLSNPFPFVNTQLCPDTTK